MADYYTLLTNAGIAYETACKAAGVPIKLTQISVGDGGGSVYNSFIKLLTPFYKEYLRHSN